MAAVFPELVEDDLALSETDLDESLAFAAILHANGETELRDHLFSAMEERISTMHRTRGEGYGVTDVYIHAMRGDRNLALGALREAIDIGWREFWWILPKDWKLSGLHRDPGFIAMMGELESDVLAQRQWFEENKEKSLL